MAREELARLLSRLPKCGKSARCWDELAESENRLIAELLHKKNSFRVIITRVPVLIGEGVPLFDTLPRDILLRRVATRPNPSGLVQSEYQIVP
jgi:hypothetical protein